MAHCLQVFTCEKKAKAFLFYLQEGLGGKKHFCTHIKSTVQPTTCSLLHLSSNAGGKGKSEH